MIRSSGLTTILFLTGLLCLCDPHWVGADMAPLQVTGGAASPRSSHQAIRMDSEEVTVRLEKTGYTVDAVFRFFNSGETVTEWVGFPKGDTSFQSSRLAPPDFVQFSAWVDGKKVEFSPEGKQWLAGKVTFEGKAATTIRVMYEAGYYRGTHASYIIGTGGPWKGKIGKALFIVDGSAIGGVGKFSAGFHHLKSAHGLRSKNAVKFELRDFEPEPGAVLWIGLSGRSFPGR